MFTRYSRYQSARRFNPGPEGTGFPGTRPRAVHSAAGVLEHVIREGERLDGLAHYYFRDSRLWWRILDANPDLLFTGVMLLDEFAGETLLIPRAKE